VMSEETIEYSFCGFLAILVSWWFKKEIAAVAVR